jgi:hypothetical protein
MKTRMFWTLALASCLIGCGKQPPAEETPVAPAAEDPAAVVEQAPAASVPVESAAMAPAFDQEFLDHMHAHAERVDELMYALDDGDLDGAKAAAYWLSRHKTVEGIPDEWQMYVNSMREAASRVEGAVDLDSARMAAEAISPQCQGCHAAAGILTKE